MNTSTHLPKGRKSGSSEDVDGFCLPFRESPLGVRWAVFFAMLVAVMFVSALAKPAQMAYSPIWLPSGLTVAVLLAFPRRQWPGYLALAWAAHFGFELHAGEAWPEAALASLGFLLEAGLSVVLAGWWFRKRRNEGGSAIGLLALAALPGPALGAAVVAAAGMVGPVSRDFFEAWLGLWCRDVLGILIVLPLAMGTARDWRDWLRDVWSTRRTEAGLLVLVAIVDIWLVCILLGRVGTEVKFLLAPVFAWTALRFQPRGVALLGAAISLTIFTLGATVAQHPFPFTADTMLVIQIFLVVSCAMALMIAVAWTEYQSSAGRLMRLHNGMSEIMILLQVVRDPEGMVIDFRILDMNPAFVAVNGSRRDEALGTLLSEFLPDPVRKYGKAAARMLMDRQPRRFEVCSEASGRFYQVSAYVTECEDQIVALAMDITAAKQREVEILRLSRMYGVVSAVNQAIVRSSTREALFADVVQALIQHGQCVAAWVGLFRSAEDRLAKVTSMGDEAMFEQLARCDPPAQEGLAKRAFEEGKTVVCTNLLNDGNARHWGAVAAARGIRSVAAFPLWEDHRPIGAVCIYSREVGMFSSTEVELLESLAQDIGFALDKLKGEAAHALMIANLVESDRRFRGLFEQAPVAYLALDTRGVLIDVNPAWLALFGALRPESIGRPFMDFVSDETRASFVREYATLITRGGDHCIDLELVKENGEVFAAQVVVRSQGDSEGRFQMAHCVIHDVDARIRYERSLREGEERITQAFEIANDGIWEANLRTGRLSFSHRFYTMLGYVPGEFDETPREWIDRIHPEDAAAIVARYPDFLASDEENFEIEYRLRDKAGDWRWIVARGRVVEKGVSGEKVRILGANSDISARKRSELALRQSERRLSLVIEGSALAAWDWDLRSGEVLFSSYWGRLLGFGQFERMVSVQEWRSYLHPEDIDRVNAAIEDHLRGRTPHYECEYRVQRRDASWIWVYDRGQVIARNGEGGPLRVAGTLRDITDRRMAEQQVREQAALLAQTLDIVLTTDVTGRVRYANRSAEIFFGFAARDLQGRPTVELFEGVAPSCDGAFISRVLSEQGWNGELSFDTGFHQGCVLSSRWSVVHSNADDPELLLVVCTDITDKRLLESRFLRAQRMESIGSLASGVAHDLNNIFLPISLAAHILKKSPPEDQRTSLYAMLDQSAQRGADLVQQLLTFGRGLDGRRVELQPRMLFHEIRRIIRETFPKNIGLETKIPDDLWTVSADPTQLHQVLLNLCLNSRDAMPEGGTLSLAGENVVFDEHYAAMNPEAEPGPYGVLEVIDTGVGIPAENIEKIFDPFFTTKDPGLGTGLGLSTVHGIVRSHGGFVQVRSQEGEGTAFKIYLPAIPSPHEVKEIPPSENIPMGHGETVLVVDDEEAVRETLRHMLENHGYRVILAPDGRQGLVCYHQQKELIRVLITDVMMPVMDGTQLIRALRSTDETLAVVAMSGLPEKEGAAEAAGIRADAFVMKPFVSEQLLIILHTVLEKRRTAPVSGEESQLR